VNGHDTHRWGRGHGAGDSTGRAAGMPITALACMTSTPADGDAMAKPTGRLKSNQAIKRPAARATKPSIEGTSFSTSSSRGGGAIGVPSRPRADENRRERVMGRNKAVAQTVAETRTAGARRSGLRRDGTGTQARESGATRLPPAGAFLAQIGAWRGMRNGARQAAARDEQ